MSNKPAHLTQGERSEQLAKEHLLNAGYQLIAQNFHSHFGEIDLICRDKNELIFVEVRFRSNPNFGSAASSVTKAKQKKIAKTAQYFILENPALNRLYMRFDVIGIDANNNIEWLQGAFQAAL
ncbi:YraN family protein [Reinekea thalattae]|uniref:UPF0102 protein FME95_11230 n=1 Tax=Reinekea thalattae TaxID=2593301 RepID=A0A5C8Z361_9GAMM|nr:YraN family protein [Reinekea thalattae]TXR51987.1 YraN family protein [Reinekea thalattae]